MMVDHPRVTGDRRRATSNEPAKAFNQPRAISDESLFKVGVKVRETELIKEALAGGEQALAVLLQENYPKVVGYFIKLTQDPELARDLTQETMVKAIKKLPKYRGAAKFSSWLIAIGSNLYRDELRKRKVVEKNRPSPGETDNKGDQEGEMKADIKRALLRLSAEKRVPLILKYYYDYSYQEIAAVLKIPVGTVRSRLHSAVRQLREALTEKLPAEDRRGNSPD